MPDIVILFDFSSGAVVPLASTVTALGAAPGPSGRPAPDVHVSERSGSLELRSA